jgi:SlyX protein
MTADPPPPGADDRLTKLELLLSHLQYDVDKLNDALISQQSQIDELRQTFSKMQSVVEHLPEPPRDLEQERPPHY